MTYLRLAFSRNCCESSVTQRCRTSLSEIDVSISRIEAFASRRGQNRLFVTFLVGNYNLTFLLKGQLLRHPEKGSFNTSRSIFFHPSLPNNYWRRSRLYFCALLKKYLLKTVFLRLQRYPGSARIGFLSTSTVSGVAQRCTSAARST